MEWKLLLKCCFRKIFEKMKLIVAFLERISYNENIKTIIITNLYNGR